MATKIILPDEGEEEVELEEETLKEEDIVEIEEEDDDEPIDLDSLSDDELIWEEGPTVKQWKAWKEEYDEVYVTVISLPNNNIVWRPLERNEYREHIKDMIQITQNEELTDAEANMISEELISKRCILFPAYTDNPKGLAGIPTTISQHVMDASGFGAIDVRRLV